MKISFNWINNLIKSGWTPEEMAEHFALMGFPVDSITPVGIQINNLITGLVKKVEKHPNADRLRVANVFDGKSERQIVCGAPNLAEGQIVPVALPGAKFSADFEIKVSKLRGVESHGMICSEKELGLSDEHQGIMVLPEGTPIGKPLQDIFGGNDIILDVEVTPNRPDLLSHLGFAREIAAKTGKKINFPHSKWKKPGSGKKIPISIKDQKLCSRYIGKVILNVKVQPSPPWMQARLKNCGIRPISNVVDVTNYVLLEYGHPLHAFDLDKLKGPEIIVRRAKSGEKLEALDDLTYELKDDMLVIADKTDPVAIAGVMGGAPSGVSDSTTNILLEAATFDAASIRKTSGKLNLRSESSYRFERGSDTTSAEEASLRAAGLILELAGGTPGPQTDTFPVKPKKKSVVLRKQYLKTVIGTDLPETKVKSVLNNLEIKVQSAKDKWTITPPDFRKDINEEADVVEEVVRSIGYDSLPSALPKIAETPIPEAQQPLPTKIISQTLRGLGLNETISSSFSNHGVSTALKFDEGSFIPLLNPISQDETIMRPGLIINLLKAAERNIHHQRETVALFEIGNRYHQENNRPIEQSGLALLWYGLTQPKTLNQKSEDVDIFFLKGIMETLNRRTPIQFSLKPHSNPPVFLHPNMTFDVIDSKGHSIGWAGMVHPSTANSFDLKRPCAIAEFNLQHLNSKPVIASSLARFPAVERDLAVVLGQQITWGEIEAAVKGAKSDLLESIKPFDIFSGGNLPAGQKSVAFRIHLRHPEHTLTDAEINTALDKIKSAIKERVGGELR